jgi:hypothetical protein
MYCSPAYTARTASRSWSSAIFNPVHTVHAQVEHHHVRAVPEIGIDGIVPVIDIGYDLHVRRVAHRGYQTHADGHVVVNEQDSDLFMGGNIAFPGRTSSLTQRGWQPFVRPFD